MLEPASDRVTGATRNSRRRRNAHTLDSHAGYLVELLPIAAKTAVGCAGIHADRSTANFAAVPLTSSQVPGKPAVAHDVDTQFSKVVASDIYARDVIDCPHRPSVASLKYRLLHP